MNSKEMKHRMKNIDSNPDFWRKIKFNLNIKQNEDVIQNDDEEEE